MLSRVPLSQHQLASDQAECQLASDQADCPPGSPYCSASAYMGCTGRPRSNVLRLLCLLCLRQLRWRLQLLLCLWQLWWLRAWGAHALAGLQANWRSSLRCAPFVRRTRALG